MPGSEALKMGSAAPRAMAPRAPRAANPRVASSREALGAALRSHADAERRRRGEAYLEEGAVRDVTRRGDEVTARVQGTRLEPYRVTVHLAASGVAQASCTCPYDGGGWCKHIVATVLALVEDDERVEQRPALRELLASQDREGLVDLIEHAAERDPDLVEMMEARAQALDVGRPAPKGRSGGAPRARKVDARATRRRVQAALHSLDHFRSSEAYWHVAEVVDSLRDILREAQGHLEAGDAASALTLLEALTDEYVADWTTLDGSDGDTGAFYGELGPIWTEALLAAELTAERRDALARKLEDWRGEIDDYGIEGVFEPAIEAARHGWQAPSLMGKPEVERAADAADGERVADLAHAGVEVLWRQGRRDEALALAERTSQPAAVVAMLAELGRAKDAVAHGMAHMASPDQALAGAGALWRVGAKADALRLADFGLRLGSSDEERGPLAEWLRDAAAEGGQHKLALQAAEIAFRGDPTLEALVAAKRLAGKQWPRVREGLLAHLRADRDARPADRVAILLEEGLQEEAMSAADAEGTYDVVELVVDAVLRSYPEWAIEASKAQAERIMNNGEARIYHHAVRWLRKCREAHRAAQRDDAWRAYLGALLDMHRRKHKLRAMLEDLARDQGATRNSRSSRS